MTEDQESKPPRAAGDPHRATVPPGAATVPAPGAVELLSADWARDIDAHVRRVEDGHLRLEDEVRRLFADGRNAEEFNRIRGDQIAALSDRVAVLEAFLQRPAAVARDALGRVGRRFLRAAEAWREPMGASPPPVEVDWSAVDPRFRTIRTEEPIRIRRATADEQRVSLDRAAIHLQQVLAARYLALFALAWPRRAHDEEAAAYKTFPPDWVPPDNVLLKVVRELVPDDPDKQLEVFSAVKKHPMVRRHRG